MNEQIEKRRNPFFEPYNTPHDTAPFDRIRLEDYEEAFMEGIRRDNEQIDKTINNPDKPTFDNTIISKEDEPDGYYDLLDRVSTVFFNLLSAETNDEMDALAQKMQPILTQHANDVRLNEKLFERIKYVHRHHRKLTPEERMLLDNCYDGFVRSAARISYASLPRRPASCRCSSRRTCSRRIKPSPCISQMRSSWTDCPRVPSRLLLRRLASVSRKGGCLPSTIPRMCRL